MRSTDIAQPTALAVFNTLTRQKDKLLAVDGNQLNVFVCGPTVYDYSHLGHGKTYTQFDFIVRYLRYRGFQVRYIQNITDIDDKIIGRARERNVSWDTLARNYEAFYLQDMTALHNKAVDSYIRATDHIPQIVSQVQRLLEKDYAYRTDDGIYYEIAKFSDYGKLSGRRELRQEDAVSRIDEGVAKRGFGDFCLWKFAKPGEPSWETPIGAGRPGWHIEDTAITEDAFGPQYDIHGGAIDLIFPHHEAEIAQMEAISGRAPLVRYWLHTGFLNIEKAKMAKSSGNSLTIRVALENLDYRVLRYFFISSHYRTTMDYSEESLAHAKGAIARLDEFVASIDTGLDDADNDQVIDAARAAIVAALDDDFGSPKALGTLFEFVRAQNIKGGSGRRTAALMSELNGFFDFLQLEGDGLSPELQCLIDERERCRLARDFTRADAIRAQLLAHGIQLYDTPAGVRWRFGGPSSRAGT